MFDEVCPKACRESSSESQILRTEYFEWFDFVNEMPYEWLSDIFKIVERNGWLDHQKGTLQNGRTGKRRYESVANGKCKKQ